MLARLTKTALVALVAMSGLGASCFSITDPFVVAVDVKDIKATYNVTPGTVASRRTRRTTSTPTSTWLVAASWWT